MPKSATFLTLCSSLQKAHMQEIRFTKVFFVLCNIHLYRTMIPSITKQNHAQITFLDHFSNYHVITPIKILLITVNNTISWLICFLESFPKQSKQSLFTAFARPYSGHSMLFFPGFSLQFPLAKQKSICLSLIKFTEH